ncbi:MAG: DinB family protein [Vicinamibacterales bacterium]
MATTETPQDYTKRILSFVAENDPHEVLKSTAVRLQALMTGRSPGDLARQPDSAHWSVTQIVAHLADAEVVAAWRIRAILAADGVPLQPFDQNDWASTFRYADTDPFESLKLFEVNRSANLKLLARVDPALHANFGMHAERGKETIAHLINLYAGHDLNHLAQVQRLLGP